MSNDRYKQVNFNAGQEVRATDLINTQKFLGARLLDQVIDQLAPGLLASAGDPDQRARAGENMSSLYAYALTASGGAIAVSGTGTDKKVKLLHGTVFQKIAAKDGNEAQLLPYTFLGTEEFTLADGHASLPRVDVLQMKLEYETGDAQARVFSTDAQYATLHANAFWANWDSVLRPKVKGTSGNNVRVRTITGGALGILESGNLLTITYVSGVTTVTALEAYLTANSTLVTVDTPGTGAHILADPGDTIAYQSLTGGVDSLLTSQTFDMQRRVKATLSIVTGTPTAAPAPIPALTAGYVPLAAFIVHPTWTTGNGFRNDDAPVATVVTTICDLRMPLRVKKYTVEASQMVADPAWWTLDPTRQFWTSLAPGGGTTFQKSLLAYCPTVLGRIVGIVAETEAIDVGDGAPGSQAWISEVVPLTSVQDLVLLVSDLRGTGPFFLDGNLYGGGEPRLQAHGGLEFIEAPANNKALAAVGNGTYGLPLWTNGFRCVWNSFEISPKVTGGSTRIAYRHDTGGNADDFVYSVSFYVAEGL